MTATGTLNYRWAQSLIAGFIAAGVRHAVISPGARSTPLTLALLRCPAVRCHVVVDERSAAFFALGLAKASGMPPLVLCTSGSAVANWFPAVMEADRGQVPLLLFSTDRPPEVQGWGANQAVDQVKIFGASVRATHALGLPDPTVSPDYLHRLAARAVSESRWPRPGPVHLNQPLREPFLPEAGDEAMAPPPLPPLVTPLPRSLPPEEALAQAAARLRGRPGVILCGGGEMPAFGPDFADAVTALAEALDCPILADPLSNLRFGPHDQSRVLAHGEAILRSAPFVHAHRPAWVLRFGAAPVSRSLLTWLEGAGEELLLVDAHDTWPDPQHRAGMLLRGNPAALCRDLAQRLQGQAATGASWCAAWRQAEAAAKEQVERILAEAEEQLFEPGVLQAVLQQLPAGGRMLIGNSMAIRDTDAFSGCGPKPLTFHGNRGVSGIDGNLSTALGMAAAVQAEDAPAPVAALLGDLGTHHDLNGLAAARGLDAVLVVSNNGGGGIFEYLPSRVLPEFEAGWLTPVAVNFAAAAAAYGVSHRKVSSLAECRAALAEAFAAGGPWLIEAVVDRQASVALHRRYWQRVQEQ